MTHYEKRISGRLYRTGRYLIALTLLTMGSLSVSGTADNGYGTVTVDEAGTIHTSNGVLPVSGLLSPEA